MKKAHKTEPARFTDDQEYKIALIKQLTHHNNLIQNQQDAIKWIQLYSGQKIEVEKQNSYTTTMGALAALIQSQTLEVRVEDKQRLDKFVQDNLPAKQVVREDVAPKEKITDIQESILNKAREFIGEMEGAIDLFVETKNFDDHDMIKSALKAENVGQPVAKKIKEWTTSQITYYTDVMETDDKEIQKAHKHIPLKKMVQLLQKWTDELETHELQKKANRKPPKRKPKPPAVQVKSLKYSKSVEMEGKKLESVPAQSIIGAGQLWTLNTKTKKLSVFVANDRQGLQVRGSSIQNYDVEQSETKTIGRNFDYIVDKVVNGGKVALRKLMQEVKAKGTPAKSRLNSDTILLRTL